MLQSLSALLVIIVMEQYGSVAEDLVDRASTIASCVVCAMFSDFMAVIIVAVTSSMLSNPAILIVETLVDDM